MVHFHEDVLSDIEKYLDTHVLFGLCYAYFNFGLAPFIVRQLSTYLKHTSYFVTVWIGFWLYVEWYLLPWHLWLLQWLIRVLLQSSMMLEYCCLAGKNRIHYAVFYPNKYRFATLDSLEIYIIWCYTKYICGTYVPYIADNMSFLYEKNSNYLQIENGVNCRYTVQLDPSTNMCTIVSHETKCHYFKQDVIYWTKLPLFVDDNWQYVRQAWLTADIHELESLPTAIETITQNLYQRRPKPCAIEINTDGTFSWMVNEKACANALSQRYAWVTHILQPHIPKDLCTLVLTYVKPSSTIRGNSGLPNSVLPLY